MPRYHPHAACSRTAAVCGGAATRARDQHGSTPPFPGDVNSVYDGRRHRHHRVTFVAAVTLVTARQLSLQRR